MWRGITLLLSLSLTYGYKVTGISTDRTVYNKQSLTGSVRGGTQLYFHGEFDETDPTLHTITIGGDPCPVIEFYGSAAYLECYTPKPTTLSLDPQLIEISHPYEEVDIGSDVVPYFTYYYPVTPLVLYMNPAEATPGDQVSFVGIWRTEDWFDYTEARIGEKQMEMYKFGEGWSVSPNSVMNLTAVMGDNIHGDGDPHIHLDDGFGTPHFYWTGQMSNLDGSEFWHFRTLARIDYIGRSSGSTEGGLRIGIEGEGFPFEDPDLIEIEIAGSPCVVDPDQIWFDYVECVTTSIDEIPSQDFYQGNAGLVRKLWVSGGSLDFSGVDLDSPDFTFHMANPQIPTDEYDDIQSISQGLFIAPKTGTYTFYISSDDNAKVYLNEDHTQDDPTLILEQTQWGATRDYFEDSGIQSDPISLVAGGSYFLKIEHQNGSGSSHFSMGMKIDQTGVNTQFDNATPVIQTITVTTPSTQREVQQVDLFTSGKYPITGGFAILKYGDITSQAIIFNTQQEPFECTSIQSQISGSMGLNGNIACSMQKVDDVYEYTFTFNYDWTDQRAQFSFLSPGETMEAQETVQVAEETIQEPSLPVTGTFEVVFNQEVVEIDMSWNADVIEYTLNMMMPSLEQDLYMLTTTDGTTSYKFMIPYRLSQVSQFSVGENNLQGGYVNGEDPESVTILVEAGTPTGGDNQFWWVIPSDFLRTKHDVSQLRMKIDGSMVICAGNCDFTYVTPPEIDSYSYSHPTLTITGTGFSDDILITSVELAKSDCDIQTITTTEIVCDMIEYVAGSGYQPKVTNSEIGYYLLGSGMTDADQVEFTLTVDDNNYQGSANGGTLLTIEGSGFFDSLDHDDYSQTVMIGEAECQIFTTSFSQITCRTSKQPDSQNSSQTSNLIVTVNGVASSAITYTYNPDYLLTITSISPMVASTVFKTELTIQGDKFGDQSDTTVYIGDQECLITEINVEGTLIKCNLLGGPKGTYKVVVEKDEIGYVEQQDFNLVFQIDSIDLSEGSVNGGTILTITGQGFSDREDTLLVFINGQEGECDIIEPKETQITCETPALPDSFAADTAYEVQIIGRLQETSDCSSTCKFTWASSKTPQMTSIDISEGKSGEQFVISGNNFGSDQSKIKVTFNGVEATVSQSLDTSFTGIVPSFKGESAEIVLYVETYGDATGTDALSFTNLLNFESMNMNQVSQNGAKMIIQGSGFTDTMTVLFGTVACDVTSVEDGQFTCDLNEYTTDQSSQGLSIQTSVSTFTCAVQDCQVQFKQERTISIDQVISTTDLEINGEFKDNTKEVSVELLSTDDQTQSYNCAVTQFTLTKIVCTPDAPTGNYNVRVSVENYGYGIQEPSNSEQPIVELRIDTVSGTPESSYAGGLSVTIQGQGLHQSVEITVCGQKVTEIFNPSGTSLTFKTPAVLTTYSQSTYTLQTTGLELNEFVPISTNSNRADNAFDESLNTWFSTSGDQEKYVGVDVGEGMKFSLTSAQLIGGGEDRQDYSDLIGTILEGSNSYVAEQDLTEGETAPGFTQIHQFKSAHNYWNQYVKSSDAAQISYRYFRVRKEDGSSWKINELELYGYLMIENDSNTQVCDIVVTSGDQQITHTDGITYSSSKTPSVTSISPTRGTSAGGEQITFQGLGFGTDSNKVTVYIDGVECTNPIVSNTEIQCTSGYREQFVQPYIEIQIEDVGYVAMGENTFLYSELWSSTTTWGGEVPPRAGETVQIPTGMNVILDQATPLLNLILIEGSLLVEQMADLSIDAYYIMVRGGLFQIGTQNDPFEQDFEITMHGNRQTAPLPVYGNKVIAIRNGILDIHGVERSPCWTQLAETASVGDTQITLIEDADWVVGDKIVIASTSFELEQAQVRTIKQVISSTQFGFEQGLEYEHISVEETYGDDTLTMRAEVGLLTRNIKIHGTEEEGETEQHGAHIMMFSEGDQSVIGRIENLELYTAGQAFSLGRYPLHMHMIGTVTKSYIRNNAVYNTFNRAVTIHGVHYLHVYNNVAYNNMGHAFFVQDGVETQNTIEHNLAIQTIPSWSLLNTDQTPASFWITNFNNFIIDNRAAGAKNYGFWFDPPVRPTGPSSSEDVNPEFVELGEFSGNVAHSNGKYGLRIFHKHVPLKKADGNFKDTSVYNQWDVYETVTAKYTDFTAYRNKVNGAIGDDLGDVWFQDFRVADNGRAGIEMAWTEFSKPFETVKIVDCLVVGKSNIYQQQEDNGSISGVPDDFQGVITAQTDGMIVQDIRFYNFEQTMYQLGDESKSQDATVRDWGGRVHKTKDLYFDDQVVRIHWEVPQRGIFHDLDGTLSGNDDGKERYVVTPMDHIEQSECVLDEELLGVVCQDVDVKRLMFHHPKPNNSFKNASLKLLRISGENQPEQEVEVTQTVVDQNGEEQEETTTEIHPLYSSISMVSGCQKKNPLEAWALPIVTGYSYRAHWGSNIKDFNSVQIDIETFEPDDGFVLLNLNFTETREHFDLIRGVTDPDANTETQDEEQENQEQEEEEEPAANVLQLQEAELDITQSYDAGDFYWTGSQNAGVQEEQQNTQEEQQETQEEQEETQEEEKFLQIWISGDPVNQFQINDISVTAHECYYNCDETDFDQVEEVVPSQEVIWSNPNIWEDGVIPQQGDEVQIEPEWIMTLDVEETPRLASLQINGILIFNSTMNIKLKADKIFVRGGSLQSGDESNPTSGVTHQIIFTGTQFSDQLNYDASFQQGNNILAVTGELNLYGESKASWGLLAQNALPGDNFIFVEAPSWMNQLNWVQDDQIAIAPSGFDQQENEEFIVNTVEAVSSNDSDWLQKEDERDQGKRDLQDDDDNLEDLNTNVVFQGVTKVFKITFKDGATIQHYHSGTSLETSDGSIIDMKTEVVNLSRNIKIRSENQQNWGCQILVDNFEDLVLTYDENYNIEINNYDRVGKVVLDNVEIDGCGQYDTEYAAIRFQRSKGSQSQITNSIIKNTGNKAISIASSENIQIYQNAIYNAMWIGLFINSGFDIKVQNNAIVSTQEYNVFPIDEGFPSAFIACFKNSPCNQVEIINNRAAGYPMGGFVSGLGRCSTVSTENVFSYNIAHSGRYGFYIAEFASSTSVQNCIGASYLTATFNDFGLASNTISSSQQFTNIYLADNLYGSTLKNLQETFDYTSYTLQGNTFVIIGETQHSYCNGNNCNQSDCSARIGMNFPISDTMDGGFDIGIMNNMNVHDPEGEPGINGKAVLSNFKFIDFSEKTRCNSQNTAIFQQYGKLELYIPQFYSGFQFEDVYQKLKMQDPRKAWLDVDVCGEILNCLALHNTFIRDEDGTFVEGDSGFVLPNNPYVAEIDYCTYNSLYNAYLCEESIDPEEYYAMLIFESEDDDKYERMLAPMYVTAYGSKHDIDEQGTQFNNPVNAHRDLIADGFYASQLRLSRFESLIFTDNYYNISSTGTWAGTLRFQLAGTQDKGAGVILALQFPDPSSRQVGIWSSDDDSVQVVSGLEYSYSRPRNVEFRDDHGTNRWFHQDRILQFLLKSEVAIKIRKIDSIRLTMELDMTLEEFYSQDTDTQFIDRLAAVLGIPSYRIRVASVARGSVIFNLYINRDQDSDDPIAELENLVDLLEEYTLSGELDEALGYDVLSISTAVDEADSQSDSQDEDDITVIIGEDAEAFKDEFEEISPFIMVSISFFLIVAITVFSLILYLKKGQLGAKSEVLKFETMISPKKDKELNESSILGQSLDVDDSVFYGRPNTANDPSFSPIDNSRGERKRNTVFEDEVSL